MYCSEANSPAFFKIHYGSRKVFNGTAPFFKDCTSPWRWLFRRWGFPFCPFKFPFLEIQSPGRVLMCPEFFFHPLTILSPSKTYTGPLACSQLIGPIPPCKLGFFVHFPPSLLLRGSASVLLFSQHSFFDTVCTLLYGSLVAFIKVVFRPQLSLCDL